MASDEKREFLAAIAPTLKSHGFKKKAATWHRVAGGFIQTFNVQGSQWSKLFYLNIGIYIIALGDRMAPLEYHCHIRSRVHSLVEDNDRYHGLLDMGNEIPSDERFLELNAIIESKAIPWLDEYSADQRIIACLSHKKEPDVWIRGEVYTLYGVSGP